MDTETHTTPDFMDIDKGGNPTDSDTLDSEEENTEVDPDIEQKKEGSAAPIGKRRKESIYPTEIHRNHVTQT
jgi:hypothetical protein